MYRSGIVAIDEALDTGEGIPPGSMVEIYGPADSSKTALALWFCRTLHEEPERMVGWVCAESNLSGSNLAWAGIDWSRFLVVRQCPTLPGLIAAREMVEGGCEVVVIDSLAAVIGSDPAMGLTFALAEGLAELKAATQEHGALVLMTNQERSQRCPRSVTSAGSSLALIRSRDYRIWLRTGAGLYRGGVQLGVRVHFILNQNGPDTSAWFRDGKFSCLWASGLRDLK